MKTKIILFNLILSSIVFLSCQDNDVINKSPVHIINKSPVLSVSVSSKTNNKVSFIAKAGPTGCCGSFSHFTSRRLATIFYITVFDKQPKIPCMCVGLIEFDAPVDISVGESGRFTFRFWRSDATMFDTTITF